MKKHRLMNHQKYFRTLCFGLSFLTAACTNESPLSTEPAEWPKTSISIQAHSRHEGRQRTGNSRRQRNNHPCRR